MDQPHVCQNELSELIYRYCLAKNGKDVLQASFVKESATYIRTFLSFFFKILREGGT
jgi:hypothetical protein